MKKFSIFLIIALGLAFYLKSLTLAQAPPMNEELVYNLNVYNGKGYGGAFTPETEDTIYLIADKNSAISARITLVYFWPVTGKFMAGWETLNEEVEGTLEILKDGKVIKSLKAQDNCLYYPKGYWGEISVLCLDEDAHTYYEKYKKAVDEYYQKITEFYKARTEYRKKAGKPVAEVEGRRENSFDTEIPKEPQPPGAPDFYVTEPRKGYIINLPPGNYQIRIRTEDGTIVQNSEKNLVVFTPRRTGGIGYEIIRDNRWTMRESCDDPATIIHAAGENTLYLIPFTQDEYNELYYNKLEDPQNPGKADRWRWVHITPIKDAVLLLLKGGKVLERVKMLPYSVKQIPSPTLEYNIVEYDKEGQPHERPTFEGYKLNLSLKGPGEYEIILLDKNSGKLIEQSRKKLIVEKFLQKLEAEKKQTASEERLQEEAKIPQTSSYGNFWKVRLPANVAWYDTGIDLDGGYSIEATGQINIGMPKSNGPNGYLGMIATRGNSPLLGVNNGALIGKIGEKGKPFLIGEHFRGTANGRLFVTVNDGPEDLYNNSGVFTIKVEKAKTLSNVALGKPVTVTTNGVEDSPPYIGESPPDITDGSLEYRSASDRAEDGCVGWANADYNELMVITITIELQGIYNITKIRYNPGNCERAGTWNADIMESPFGRTPTNPGSPYQGAWTEQTGNITASKVTIKLEKTRRSYATDWLFIGEIEVWGTPAEE